jgi:hypothetical protein
MGSEGRVTFRSFSRFVRWHRWELLVFFLGCAMLLAVGIDTGWGLLAMNLVAQPLWVGPVRRFAGRPSLVIARARRLAWKRLRSQPLRGWTR